MGAGLRLRGLALRYPQLSARLLRAYLRFFGHVPARLEWIVLDLKRELQLGWTKKVLALRGGGRVEVDSRSAVGREIYFTGTYEPDVSAALDRWVKPGMVCIDAGAN